MRTRDLFAGCYIYKSGAHSLEAEVVPGTDLKLDLYRRRQIEYEQPWHLPFKQLANLSVDPISTDTARLHKVETLTRNSIRKLISTTTALRSGCALRNEYFIINASGDDERQRIEDALVIAFNTTVSGSSAPIDVGTRFEAILKQSLSTVQ